MFAKSKLLLALCVVFTVTACSQPPKQTIKFKNRADFQAYVDNIEMPDSFKDAIKQGTSQVSGKYVNNVVTYLKLEGDPVKALVKRYGLKAEVGVDGVDITAAVAACVADLIREGDKVNTRGYGGRDNSGWLQMEELAGSGEWSEGATYFEQAAKLRNGDQKRAPASQIDTGN